MPKNLISLITIVGGLLQSSISLSVLFLPIIPISNGRASYIQMGGNVLGYGFLLLMIAVGVMAFISTRIDNPAQVCRLRWLSVLSSASFVVIGAWGIGLLFLPGTLCLLIAALACRQRTYATR